MLKTHMQLNTLQKIEEDLHCSIWVQEKESRVVEEAMNTSHYNRCQEHVS
jgi:hypothetical protein